MRDRLYKYEHFSQESARAEFGIRNETSSCGGGQ